MFVRVLLVLSIFNFVACNEQNHKETYVKETNNSSYKSKTEIKTSGLPQTTPPQSSPNENQKIGIMTYYGQWKSTIDKLNGIITEMKLTIGLIGASLEQKVFVDCPQLSACTSTEIFYYAFRPVLNVVESNGNISKIEFELMDVHVIVGDSSIADLYNQYSYFGFNDWVPATNRKVTGLKRTPANKALPITADKIKLLMQRQGDQLKISGLYPELNNSDFYPADSQLNGSSSLSFNVD